MATEWLKDRPWIVFRLLALSYVYWLVSNVALNAIVFRWGSLFSSSFESMLSFEVARPFAFRILTPLLINSVYFLTPAALLDALHSAGWNGGMSRLEYAQSHYQWGDSGGERFYLWLCMAGFTFFVTLWVLRHTLRSHARVSPMLADWLPPVALLCFPMLFTEGAYIYDITDLLLASLLFHTLLGRLWIANYCVLLLALLNKEANALLAVWPLAVWTMRRDSSLLRHGVAQLAIGLAVITAGRWLMADREGVGQAFYLWENLRFLAEISTYFGFIDAFAPTLPLPRGYNIINLVFVFGLVLLGYREGLREAWVVFVVTIIVIFPLYLAFGYRDEVRVFVPVWPAAVVLAGGVAECLYRTNGNGVYES